MTTAPAQRIRTRNRMGWSSGVLSPLSLAFIEFSGECAEPVVDIGASYGAASLAALATGATVIANDLDAGHLRELESCVPPEARTRLTTRAAHFPRELHFEPATIGAVHAANVLHFLTGNQIERGFREIARWLRPGGKVFVQAATPYQAPFARFIEEFERRTRDGVRWPGWIDKVSQWCDHKQLSQMPRSIHLLDDRLLRRAAEAAGLFVERAELSSRPDLPAGLRLDGREAAIVIAAAAPCPHH